MNAGPPSGWETALREALGKRTGIPSNAFRWCNGAGDGLDGLVIDRYHRHLQVSLYRPEWLSVEEEIVRVLQTLVPVDFLVIKERLEPDSAARPVMRVKIGESGNSKTIVEEAGARFEVDLLDTVNPGLFLDMRANRLRLRALCPREGIMLNLFSYTGSFSVHARLQGVRKAINVDVSGKILEKVRRNYALNGLEYQPGECFRGDAREYVRWAIRKGKSADLVVIDPPSFSRAASGLFQVERDLQDLLSACLRLTAPRGIILVATNCSAVSSARLRDWINSSARLVDRHLAWSETLGQDCDFPGSGRMRESHLAGYLIGLRN